MAQADVVHAQQFFFRPNTSTWVVWVAEQEDGCLLVGALPFKVLPVNHIGWLVVNDGCLKRTFQYFTPIIADAGEEAVVDGRRHQYSFSGHGQCFDDCRHCWYDSRGILDPFTLNLPVVTAVEPVDDAAVIALADDGIAEHTMFHSFLQCLCNLRQYLEVHVCHPQGNNVLYVCLVPFHAVGSPANDGFVEVVLAHSFLIFLFR